MKLFKVFSYAIKGIYYGFRTQRNLRIQAVIFILVMVAAAISGFSLNEFLIVILCSGLVIAAEMLNTAIEVLVDMVSPDWNEKAGMVKDISAGAVLIVSITSAITGLLLFARHFDFI